MRDVEIEEARVKVTVSLQKEAATKPLQPGQMIKITHLKVAKNKLCGKKLKSSDYTSVSVSIMNFSVSPSIPSKSRLQVSCSADPPLVGSHCTPGLKSSF